MEILIIGVANELMGQVEKLNDQLKGSYMLHLADKDEASEVFPSINPDCVLIDASLVHSDGVQIIQTIRQNHKISQIPVILLTSDPEKDRIPDLIKYGVTDFIQKPLNDKELVSRLKSAGERKKHNSAREFGVFPAAEVSEGLIQSVMFLSPAGEIEWVNDGFEQIYEYPLEEYIHHFGNHFIFNDNEGFQLILDRLKSEEQSFTYEHRINSDTTNLKWIQTTLIPLFDTDGTLNKIVAVETDITWLRIDKKKTEDLLSNILPYEIVEQLKIRGKVKSKRYKKVSVLFADFKNFTRLTKTMTVDELISELNVYVRKFDEIIEKHYIEKIKTIGDAYMCAGGLPLKNFSNPFDVTLASLEIQKYVRDQVRKKKDKGEPPWELRLGIHTGEVMAGVIGTKKFAYDIWGNTVNIASRMEETSKVGMVNISGATYKHIKDYFHCTYRGKISMKNMPEEVDMYFVNRLKPEYSEDDEGMFPNEHFREILAAY